MRKIKQVLIQQDTEGDGFVTIPEGGVPVIRTTVDEGGYYAPPVANFLRCGCPKVQIYSTYNSHSEESRSEQIKSLDATLEKIAVDGETFYVVDDFPIISITRKIS
jgi:hypothetical protein